MEHREYLIAAENARREARSPEKVEADRAYRGQYYIDHKDEFRVRSHEYQRTHKVEIRAARRRWWNGLSPERKDEIKANRREYAREYRAKYPERHAEYARQYRARKYGATVGVITDAMIEAKWDYWGGNCWMCGRQACEWDHLKPLAKGGLHALSNSRPACRNCNARKSDKWPFDLTPFQDPFGLANEPLDERYELRLDEE